MKNRIMLENQLLSGDLEGQIEAFVEHDNHLRYHESLNNVTPAEAYFGRAPAILQQRERIKRQTIEDRGLDTEPSEAEPFWTAFLRKLTRRRLRRLKLVISDAHEGIKAAVSKPLCAT